MASGVHGWTDLRHSFAVAALIAGTPSTKPTCGEAWGAVGLPGRADPASTYWYLEASAELLVRRRRPAQVVVAGTVMTALAPTLKAYFTDRLAQRQASPHTVASYRDTFCLLLRFTQRQLGRAPSMLDFADLDAPLVGAFLDHLEQRPGQLAGHPQ